MERMKALRTPRARILAWSGAAFLVLAVAAGASWLVLGKAGRAGGSRIGSPGERADGPGIGHETSLAAIREGRFGEAFPFYQGLDANSFGAEDFSALGTVLLQGDHLTLGWTALEAARRVDPRHEPTNRALDALQGKLTLTTGQESMAIREAVDEVEFLGGVRGGPPLGMLVLGLARYSGDPGRERDFLDRLLVRDRSVLRAVATVEEALKLLARLLLETGRPDDAIEMLRPMIAQAPGAGTDADGRAASVIRSRNDREAAWLLSRAALQLDRNEMADAMRVLAAGFGGDSSPTPEPSPYVGSRRCGDCHGAIFQAQQGNIPHARTLYFGSGLKDVPLPTQPVPDPVVPGITHHFSRQADDRIKLETRVDNQVVQAVITYAVGSGNHGITMIGRDSLVGRIASCVSPISARDRNGARPRGSTPRRRNRPIPSD